MDFSQGTFFRRISSEEELPDRLPAQMHLSLKKVIQSVSVRQIIQPATPSSNNKSIRYQSYLNMRFLILVVSLLVLLAVAGFVCLYHVASFL
jgi:hypothetical protein